MLKKIAVALAACKFELGNIVNGKIWVQMTPCGHFSAIDGRPAILDGKPQKIKTWFIDAASAQLVIDKFNQRKNDMVVDYEHQTLYKEKNGQPAPAAAWIEQLEWLDGQGLFGLADLTSEAVEFITSKKYRYYSPVFGYDQDGTVTDMLMGAFTNYAGIDGMMPLAKLAADIFLNQLNPPEETTMTLEELLAKLRELLGLAADADEAQVLDALGKLVKNNNDPKKAVAAATASISKVLGVDEKSTPEQLVAACSALKTAAMAKANPDPAKFVPIDVVTGLQTQMAALSAQVNGDKVSRLVDKAVTDGRLLPVMVDWAIELGKKDIAALTAYLEQMPAIAALTATQSRDQRPDPNNFNLTQIELDTAALTGLTPKEFADQKNKEQK